MLNFSDSHLEYPCSTRDTKSNKKQFEVVLIDADDTLWENYFYFEQARNTFLNFMEKQGFDRENVNYYLNHFDTKRLEEIGFGSNGFKKAMEFTLSQFYNESKKEIGTTELKLLEKIKTFIYNQPSIPYPGVKETLEYLKRKYKLILLTKGEEKEQLNKVERSGLSRFFNSSIVLNDKKEEHYRELIVSLKLNPEKTVMVGNSPKSDINPAVKAGMYGILIQRETQWEYEEEELIDSDRIIIIRSFKELKNVL
ncbi:conserved hypothetical protein [Thermotomaculum hydrothermale]|uniref:Haloacid dehalogenase domain protein hydrolase n=1 Tax=Thermotomaculum hydrothermale TaxID=981385 RepID=A0A7R6SZH7_9BACT|nr:HAD family hydrolase [Thermotomaculum hydrothermale]BBB32762.1 conserved hypothetical protein [Thermotomaculum hydrothermale]